MKVHIQDKKTASNITAYLFLTVILTGLLLISLKFNINQLKQETLEMSRIQAWSIFYMNVLWRTGNAVQGGVYIPVTEPALRWAGVEDGRVEKKDKGVGKRWSFYSRSWLRSDLKINKS